MPFLDHLEELRWTLMRSLIAVVIGSIICFIFNEKIIQALRWVAPPDMNLVILAPTEGFMISVKVALFAGLVLALPFVAYEFWRFIVPGLLSKEKKLVPPIVFFTVLCFILGAAFSYFLILRYALKFLLNFQEQTENMIAIGKYLGFVVTLILVFGIVFELPVMSFFLSRIGLLTPDFLRTKRRYGIVIIFIVAALLTPPDVMTQLMLAVPLIVLYEISIWVSAMAVKKKEQKEAEDLAG
ncbi:twin-arginine translocase subunit TatC [candidate division KSB1 bacterium]|nr:twin-arginine translocase subunit TatC [candidate division KSB1 bacterium]